MSTLTPYRKEELRANILLIDDSKVINNIVKKLIKNTKIQLDFSTDGLSGLKKVKSKDYDLILMDLQMPIMDGFQATSEIRALKENKYKKLPIIAITALKIDEIKDLALSVGVNDFIQKPINPKKFIDIIDTYIQIPA